MSATVNPPDFDPARQLEIIRRALAKQSFCVLATSSAADRPHAVGLMYSVVDLTLYFVVGRETIKVRNVLENPNVAVCVPVRKYLFGPPLAVQFQGTGRILEPADPEVRELVATGRLKRIAALGALDKPRTCLIRVSPHRRISSYGLGIPLRRLLRDVSQGARSVQLP
jgi:hypothetical protein